MSLALFIGSLACGCGGGGGISTTPPPTPTVAAPQVQTTAEQNGAQLVSLSSTTAGATIHYTLDGSTPTATSQIYQAPVLVDSGLAVKAIAISAGTESNVTSQSFTMSIPSGTLVWSDEFANSTGSNAQPSPGVWTYDTGNNGFGNSELENYCAWGSSTAPCSTAAPNAYVGIDGVLHIVAEEPSTGVYTSARMRSQGLFSFQYGRLEARMKLPEAQGMWPAFWLLGNNIATINWPACGELDVMEHIDGNDPPPYFGAPPAGYDWIAGSIHGGASGAELSESMQYHPSGFSAADWHTYGMIWSKGEIQYYVDDPSNVYATYKSTDGAFNGKWPFDDGPEFIILNLAVGGSWPGAPDATTTFPAEMQVDYVRLYTN
ncbi:MAG TPA: family 16 glycosylhydrolase [Terracidiphilus sp.]|nr:family 16 glycosylhydrolase [Terracidiphilus sp.]